MKLKHFFLLCVIAILIIFNFVSCTDNQRAKNWGGTMNITVPAGEEFVNATWKNNDLWIITRDKANPNKFYMHESSNFGVMQGTVKITQ